MEDDIRAYYSDVLFSIKTTEVEGYIHLLITADWHMAFRQMRYVIVTMQRHIEAGNKKLRLFVPVLFYTVRRSPCPYS